MAPLAEGPALTITDAAHNQGNPHFHFLPPLVKQASYSGTPDPAAAPQVMICEWDGNQCVDVVAAFDETEGTDGELVRYDPSSGQYQVNWHTDRCLTGPCALDPSRDYRLRVVAGAIELGHADLDIASTGRELKNAETNEIIGLVNGRTLAVKFRVERGAISRVAIGSSAIVGNAGGYLSTPDGRVGLTIPPGALNGPGAISINAANGLPTLGGHAVPVDLGPDGQTFSLPVTLTLGFDPHQLPEGVSPEALRLMTWLVDHWEEVPGAVLNVFENTISAQISHFSYYWVGIAPNTVTQNGALTLMPGQTASYTARAGYIVQQPQQVCYRHRHGFSSVTHCYTQITNVNYPVPGMGVNWSSQNSAIAFFATPSFSVTGTDGIAVSPLLTANKPGTTTILGLLVGGGGAQGTSLLTVETPGFASISAGDRHACGLSPSGLAYCWGDNSAGQLGNISSLASSRAVPVATTQTFAWIGAGDSHTCALTATGEAWCWGGNRAGELGDGTTTARPIPTRVTGGHTFATLDLGNFTTCGVTTGGATLCWGSGGRPDGDLGALGTPAPAICPGYFGVGGWPCATAPVVVSGGHAFTQVTVGGFSACGLLADGKSLCWGWNAFMQLGNNTIQGPVPTPVQTAIGFSTIAMGISHSCGLDAGGAAYCWGGAAFNWGQLGDGGFTSAPVPRLVAPGLSFRSIRPSKGNNIFVFTCGVTTADIAYCWGANSSGQLGAAAPLTCTSQTQFPCSALPLPVGGGLTFRDVSSGGAFACGVTTNNEAYCWGSNSRGQIGDGTVSNALAPARVVH